jgi:hypothetical protein
MLSVRMNRQRRPKRIEKLETEMFSWAVVWSQEFMATEKEFACAYKSNSKGSTLHDPHAFTAQSFPSPIDMKLSVRTSSLGSQWLRAAMGLLHIVRCLNILQRGGRASSGGPGITLVCSNIRDVLMAKLLLGILYRILGTPLDSLRMFLPIASSIEPSVRKF